MCARIAIHHHPGSFSDRWLACCAEKGIAHKVVNCYEASIMSQLASMSALLWQHSHEIAEDTIMANHVLRAAELMGLVVFQNSDTSWHFDSKIAQKYLLEAVGAPLVSTYVFYQPQAALAWVEQTEFPKVFKLSRGAGASNVQLVRNVDQARRLLKWAFRPGGSLCATRSCDGFAAGGARFYNMGGSPGASGCLPND